MNGPDSRPLRGCLCAAALAAAATAAGACGETLDARARRLLDSKTHTIAFAPVPAPWRAGRHFAVDVEVCAHAGDEPLALRVDADMPAHRHGMNYAVTVRKLAPNRYRAEGLLFHMPGRWRLRFDLSVDGKLLAFVHEVDVP